MLAELREDNGELAKRMRETYEMIDAHNDVATVNLLEVFIDETERRAWFLSEVSHASRRSPARPVPRVPRFFVPHLQHVLADLHWSLRELSGTRARRLPACAFRPSSE
jgi:hypothetical protein